MLSPRVNVLALPHRQHITVNVTISFLLPIKELLIYFTLHNDAACNQGDGDFDSLHLTYFLPPRM